jgi:hypothetical protein
LAQDKRKQTPFNNSDTISLQNLRLATIKLPAAMISHGG